jgi:peptide/nickel transport system permease protein
MGRSYLQKTEVAELIASRLPATLLLMVAAIFCELLLGVTMGVVAALTRGRLADQALMIGSFLAVSAPQFVVSLLLLYVFAVRLGWFPIGGYGTFAHLVLPALTLGIVTAAPLARLTRGKVIEAGNQDYVRTARAKGLPERRVWFVHALRNGILPVVTYLGPAAAGLVSGSFVVESLFDVPGLGRLFVSSIINRDFTLILGTTLVYAAALLVLNLVADLRLADLPGIAIVRRIGMAHWFAVRRRGIGLDRETDMQPPVGQPTQIGELPAAPAVFSCGAVGDEPRLAGQINDPVLAEFIVDLVEWGRECQTKLRAVKGLVQP